MIKDKKYRYKDKRIPRVTKFFPGQQFQPDSDRNFPRLIITLTFSPRKGNFLLFKDEFDMGTAYKTFKKRWVTLDGGPSVCQKI